MSIKKDSASIASVQAGDVLVSHPTAVREHDISIVPNAPHAVSPTHEAAVSDGCSEADAAGVDAWLTEDQTHVVRIAANRTPEDESATDRYRAARVAARELSHGDLGTTPAAQ